MKTYVCRYVILGTATVTADSPEDAMKKAFRTVRRKLKRPVHQPVLEWEVPVIKDGPDDHGRIKDFIR